MRNNNWFLVVGLLVASGCGDGETRETSLGTMTTMTTVPGTTAEGSSTGEPGSGSGTTETPTTGSSVGGTGTGTSTGEGTSSGTTAGVGCEPLLECGEDCVDISNDIAHCGGCDKACAPGELCEDSKCQSACPMGQVECGGSCFDTNSSPDHCGGCDMPCDAKEVCMAGQCALTCDPGLEVCGGGCVDLQSDAAHCGMCDKACAGCEVCGAGTCALPAAPPAPGMIVGELKPCLNAQGAYSVPAVMGATKYTWTVPPDAMVVLGQDTNMATIKFAAQSGQVCVSFNDGCVESAKSCVDVALQGASGNKTFSFTGGAQEFVVPACALNVTVELWGAQGGGAKCCDNSIQDDGGKGGYVKASLAANPGDKWQVYVGGKGVTEGAGGWNGGGPGSQYGAGGGGGSDVRIGGVGLNNRSLAAGGGGGGNCGCPDHGAGGAGGGLTGDIGNSLNGGFIGGGGGTQNAGGTAGSAPGQAGAVGVGGGPVSYHVAGGGGGWYGGGGAYASGGGGGSSYYGNAMNASTQKGLRTGNGEVKISW